MTFQKVVPYIYSNERSKNLLKILFYRYSIGYKDLNGMNLPING